MCNAITWEGSKPITHGNAAASAETITKGVSKAQRRMAMNLALSAWKRQEGFAKDISFELGLEE